MRDTPTNHPANLAGNHEPASARQPNPAAFLSQNAKPPRASATVVLVRERRVDRSDGTADPDGLEVLLLKRADRQDYNGGAWVFPGGLVDASDAASFASMQTRVAVGDDPWSVEHIAALRECFEECGVLLACGQDDNQSALTDRDTQAMQTWRATMNQGTHSLAQCLSAHGLKPDVSALRSLSRWVTPLGMAKRFDTRFFIARAPQEQTVQVDGTETVEARWVSPSQPLERGAGYRLLTPTRVTLEWLARCASVDDAFDRARAWHQQTRHAPIVPRLAVDHRGVRPVTPDEAAYEEVGKLDPEGRATVACTIKPGAPVQLSPRVIRVTAPNASMMTGPGTNSYLVGSGGNHAWTVIDPGPDDDAHLEALLAAAPGPIDRILVTHTHRDHSPLAMRLRARTGAKTHGRLPAHADNQDTAFVPDVPLMGGERLVLDGGRATLLVIHTPGHASNHLCYRLEEEALLFAGDQVMQRGTVVINPPDGDMGAYVESLRDLSMTHGDLQWIAPGHGFLMARPHAVFDGIVAHRLQREAKVVAAFGGDVHALSTDQLVARVYADVHAGLHALAKRSLAAHLLKLEREERVVRVGGLRADATSAVNDTTVWRLANSRDWLGPR